MDLLPFPDDLAIIARLLMDDRLRDAQARRLIRLARAREHDDATATPSAERSCRPRTRRILLGIALASPFAIILGGLV